MRRRLPDRRAHAAPGNRRSLESARTTRRKPSWRKSRRRCASPSASCSACRPANPRAARWSPRSNGSASTVFMTPRSAPILTVIEEANEFLDRKTKGGKLPLFTSCCPGWVKFAEQYFPELLPNLSTCKSPQQMLGALCQGTVAGGTRRGKRKSRDGFHHALHGEEIRGQAAGICHGRHRRKWITCSPRRNWRG